MQLAPTSQVLLTASGLKMPRFWSKQRVEHAWGTRMEHAWGTRIHICMHIYIYIYIHVMPNTNQAKCSEVLNLLSITVCKKAKRIEAKPKPALPVQCPGPGQGPGLIQNSSYLSPKSTVVQSATKTKCHFKASQNLLSSGTTGLAFLFQSLPAGCPLGSSHSSISTSNGVGAIRTTAV